MRFPRITFALAAALAAAEPASADGWVLARTPNFVVVTDAGEKSARRVARQFEVFRELFRSVVDVQRDSARPLVILAVRGEAGLNALVPRHAKGALAGIFVPGGDLHHIALRLDVEGEHPYHVIYHEYVHLLVRMHFRQIPLWLNEGLAEFYATAKVREADVEFGQMLPWHVQLLRQVTVLPLDKLLAVDHSSPEYNEGRRITLFYAQAAALTHYFLMSERGVHRRDLLNYLTLLGQGVSEAEAQQRALGDLATLDKALSRYLNNLQFFGLRAPLRAEPPAAAVAPLSEADALSVRAQFLVHYGARAEARALADEALKRDPNQALAHEVRARVLAARGERREAIAELTRAAELAPNDAIVQYRLGVTEPRREDAASLARRERSLRKAIDLQPRYAPARSALAALLEDTDRAEEAIAQAQAAVALEPGETEHALRLASAQRAAGHKAAADAIEEDLIRAAHADPQLLAQVAWLFRSTSRSAEAEAMVRKVRADRPRFLRATTLLASMMLEQERYDEAEGLYREALKLQPDDPGLLNSLGYMNADRNVRVPEALQLIEKALRKYPDSANFLDSRGWALFRLGRLAEAEKDLRRALDKGTPSAEMLDHLGDVLAAKGARTEAVEHWRRALDREDLSDDTRSRIEAKLATGARLRPRGEQLAPSADDLAAASAAW